MCSEDFGSPNSFRSLYDKIYKIIIPRINISCFDDKQFNIISFIRTRVFNYILLETAKSPIFVHDVLLKNIVHFYKIIVDILQKYIAEKDDLKF